MQRHLYKAQLLTALSALDAKSTVLKDDLLGHADSVNVYVVFGAGTSAGAVVVEVAHDPLYTGTWAILGTLTWAAVSRVHNYAVVGSHIAMRLRISVAIVGGTVDAHVLVSG